MPGPPQQPPIGLQLSRTARTVTRAFDEALRDAGGSQSTWLVLLSLKTGRWRTQSELAEAVGLRGPTLTHHLDAMEREGLVTRTRDPENRRIQRVELTDAGEEAFHRLRKVVTAFDRRLRSGFAEHELETLRDALARLEAAVTAPADRPPRG
jgi:MarR family transcriptional regulator, transcriptional regulator for hemolysin